MFGRRRKQQQREEEAAREAERRALLEELAKRPDTVCPFLGLEDARAEFRNRVSEAHRCYAFGDPAELSAEQQQKVCLQRGYGNCPRYLRGVLVIPTEELEALRRPQPAPPPVAAEAPAPAPQPAGGGRRGVVVALVVLLLLAGGSGAAFLALGGPGGVAQETASPSPDPASPTTSPEGSAPPSLEATTTPEPTPVVIPSGAALPTPGPGDVSTGYAIRVEAGRYPTLEMEGDGTPIGPAVANFDGTSWAPVQRLELDGDIYWRTLEGGYLGRAYSRALSNGFVIFETFENEEREPRFRELEEDEY